MTNDDEYEFLVAREDFDYIRAHNILDPYVEDEDPLALCFLAEMYELGLGVEQSDANALAVYERSARAGNLNAQKTLGNRYGISSAPGSKELSAKWWTVAAESGDIESRAKCAFLLISGDGVERDTTRGFELLHAQSCLVSGASFARYQLGEIYRLGVYVEPQPLYAVYWYLKAMLSETFEEEPDDQEAMLSETLEEMPDDRIFSKAKRGLQQLMSSGDITDAEVKAILASLNKHEDF